MVERLVVGDRRILPRRETCVGAGSGPIALCNTPRDQREEGGAMGTPGAVRVLTTHRLVRVALTALVVGLLASACSGGSDSDPRVLEAGQVDIKLPAGYKVEGKKIIAPREASTPTTAVAAAAGTPAGAPGGDSTTPTTAKSSVPIKSSGNATSDLLKSFGKFRDCLNDLGVKFIGAPDASNPESPTNDPDYLKSLSTCAARSNIVQALTAAQSEQDSLTPKQIKQRNEGYLDWRDCMIKRGWKIPKPTPDAKGRLFAFGANSGPQIQPPAGKDLFNSKDIEQCTSKATTKFQKKHPNVDING